MDLKYALAYVIGLMLTYFVGKIWILDIKHLTISRLYMGLFIIIGGLIFNKIFKEDALKIENKIAVLGAWAAVTYLAMSFLFDFKVNFDIIKVIITMFHWNLVFYFLGAVLSLFKSEQRGESVLRLIFSLMGLLFLHVTVFPENWTYCNPLGFRSRLCYKRTLT